MKTARHFSYLAIALLTILTACSDDSPKEITPPNPIDISKGEDYGKNNTKDDVVTGGVSERGYTVATLHGYVNDGYSFIEGMGIVYNTDKAELEKNIGWREKVSSFDVGSDNRRFTIYLTDLEPNTVYYYYAWAGSKTANEILSFTTKTDQELIKELDIRMDSARFDDSDYSAYFYWSVNKQAVYDYQSEKYLYENGIYDNQTGQVLYDIERDGHAPLALHNINVTYLIDNKKDTTFNTRYSNIRFFTLNYGNEHNERIVLIEPKFIYEFDKLSGTIPVSSYITLGDLFESEHLTCNVPAPVSQFSGAVDFGLSVKWAACNLGASTPIEFGTKLPWESATSSTEQLGAGWRLPTTSEARELLKHSRRSFISWCGVKGYLFYGGKNGSRLFFPCGNDVESSCYWTSNFDEYRWDPDENRVWYYSFWDFNYGSHYLREGKTFFSRPVTQLSQPSPSPVADGELVGVWKEENDNSSVSSILYMILQEDGHGVFLVDQQEGKLEDDGTFTYTFSDNILSLQYDEYHNIENATETMYVTSLTSNELKVIWDGSTRHFTKMSTAPVATVRR